MKLGIVDLDTSHPQNWIPIERKLGHEVVGVWDGGAVHPHEYVEKFAADHELRLFPSIEAMVPEVDGVIIHGCDWDTHIDKARPFVEAGKSVLIDKPVAGNLADLNQVREWVRQGARITGGSSLRFCFETQEWLRHPVEDRGTPRTVFCGCGVDEFNYGIHAYAMLSGIMGPGIRSVRHLGMDVQRRIQVKWHDGRQGFLAIGKAESWLPFYATIVTERSATQFQADSSVLYQALLEATLPYMAGEAGEPPVPIEDLLEPELCALAARASWVNGDVEVAIAGLDAENRGYDGNTFAAEYKKARYPEGK